MYDDERYSLEAMFQLNGVVDQYLFGKDRQEKNIIVVNKKILSNYNEWIPY